MLISAEPWIVGVKLSFDPGYPEQGPVRVFPHLSKGLPSPETLAALSKT